jgi:hypothetical protein
MPKREQKPVTIERLERGLLLLAHFSERDGPVYVPIYERLNGFEIVTEGRK